MPKRRENGKRIVLTGFAALLACCVMVGCADVDDNVRMAEDDVRHSYPTQEFSDVEMIHTSEGKDVFRLRAPVLERYDFLDKAVLYPRVEIDFFNDGSVSSTINADTGVVLNEGNELVAIGNVVVTTDTGMTVFSPELRWTRFDHMIRSDTTVILVSEEGDTLRGVGLEASDDLKFRRILQPEGVTFRTVRQDSAEENDEQTPFDIGLSPDSSEANSSLDTLEVDAVPEVSVADTAKGIDE